MWRAFNPQSCLLLVAVASAAPTGDEAGHLSEVRQWEASVAAESHSAVKRSTRTVNSFQEIPKTTFACDAQESPGIFADQETGCQVFHYCQPGGRVDSFFCPNLTLFNQQYFVCDWEYNVDCSQASKYFSLNDQLFASALQILPSQTDLLGAASSAEASQGVHHAAHTGAIHPIVHGEASVVNTNSFNPDGSSSQAGPTHLRAALPAGALGVPAVLDTVATPRVAAVAPIAGSALALGGLSPLAQPVFQSALNLATGSLLHPVDGVVSGQLSRVGKTSSDEAQSYDDAVADPEPSAPAAYSSPSLAPAPVPSPLPSYSSDPYDDAVADPEPYPGATPEALAAAGLPLPYPSTARADSPPAAVVASSSVDLSTYDDAVADPEPYPGATPAALLAQGLPLPYKPSYAAPVASYDSADPEPAPQDNPKITSTQYSPAPSAKYIQYKSAGQFDSADPEPAAAAYLASNTIDLTSSSDFDDSPADPEPDPSSYGVAPNTYTSFHPDPDSEPSADPEFTSY